MLLASRGSGHRLFLPTNYSRKKVSHHHHHQFNSQCICFWEETRYFYKIQLNPMQNSCNSLLAKLFNLQTKSNENCINTRKPFLLDYCCRRQHMDITHSRQCLQMPLLVPTSTKSSSKAHNTCYCTSHCHVNNSEAICHRLSCYSQLHLKRQNRSHPANGTHWVTAGNSCSQNSVRELSVRELQRTVLNQDCNRTRHVNVMSPSSTTLVTKVLSTALRCQSQLQVKVKDGHAQWWA